MKICAVQFKPLKGDIAANIARHKEIAGLAAGLGANIVLFPELSLTGYEPTLANELATTMSDTRFDDLQQASDAGPIIIGAGMPVKNDPGITISMLLFQPGQPRQVYSKKYIHPDEAPFFIPGQNAAAILENKKIALAICYEVFVDEHATYARQNGACLYLASVAKSANGIDKAMKRMPAVARDHAMTVVMSNCIGPCDNFNAAGRSAAWNEEGKLIGQLDSVSESLLLIDTGTQEVIKKMI